MGNHKTHQRSTSLGYQVSKAGTGPKSTDNKNVEPDNQVLDKIGNDPGFRPGIGPTYEESWSSSVHHSNYIKNAKYVAYFLIAVVAAIISLLTILSVIPILESYSLDTGFIGPFIILFGTFISYLCVAYLSHSITAKKCNTSGIVLFLIVMFYISMYLWYFNLSTRMKAYKLGIRYLGKGALFLFISILSILGLILVGSYSGLSSTVFLLIPLIWCLFLLFEWWFY